MKQRHRLSWTALLAPGLMTLAWASPSPAQRVGVQGGNIYIVDAQGQGHRLSQSGLDSSPSLSPDKKWVAWIRDTPRQVIGSGADDEPASELWITRSNGKDAHILVRGAEGPVDGPLQQAPIAAFDSPQFSPDSKTIYMLSSAWTTSRAIHAIDAATAKSRFVCPGNELEVVQRGKYRGHLIVQQHRYHKGGGSYDWYYLCTAGGREVRVIGEDAGAFKKRYASGSK